MRNDLLGQNNPAPDRKISCGTAQLPKSPPLNGRATYYAAKAIHTMITKRQAQPKRVLIEKSQTHDGISDD